MNSKFTPKNYPLLGTLKYSNGKIYVGEWHDGQRHGKGIYYYPDGSRFEGTWDNNKKNGEGKHKKNEV